jgi:hypothetical protein
MSWRVKTCRDPRLVPVANQFTKSPMERRMTEKSLRFPKKEKLQKIGQSDIAISDAEGKYVYYLLATASAAIFVALQRTEGEGFRESQILLGLAVLCWIASFIAGCVNRQSEISKFTERFWADTMQFLPSCLRIEADEKKISLDDELIKKVDDLSKEIVKSRDSASHRAHKTARWCYEVQFGLLILGGLFFLLWHLYDMWLRTP